MYSLIARAVAWIMLIFTLVWIRPINEGTTSKEEHTHNDRMEAPLHERTPKLAQLGSGPTLRVVEMSSGSTLVF